MSDPSSRPVRQRFALQADVPLRPYLVAAITSTVGTAIVVLWAGAELPKAVAVVGGVLMAAGVALMLLAMLITHRLKSVVMLDEDGVTLSRGRSNRTLRWSQVEQVRLAGPRMIVLAKPKNGRSLNILNPGGSSATTFTAIGDAISERLNADRGYTTLT